MAGFDDWGADTNGSEHNNPNLNHDQFKPVNPKTVTPAEHATHVQNIVSSVQAASPSERRAGSRFYSRAHRDAYNVGQNRNPGMQPYGGKGAERTGHARMTGTQALAHANDPRASDAATTRGAGAIAALSPSSPAGMDWEHNPTAAYEAQSLTSAQVGHFRTADDALGKVSKAVGASRTAKNSGTASDVRDATRHAAKMGEEYKVASDTARAPLEGTSLKHAGNKAILKAHSILSGEVSPEKALPMKAKTGHFYTNINEPDNETAATVDGRSHDIAVGKHLPWDTQRGLQAQGRYKYFNDTHVEAAHALGMRSPSSVQATSWIQDKNSMMAKASAGLRNLGRAAHGSRGNEGQ